MKRIGKWIGGLAAVCIIILGLVTAWLFLGGSAFQPIEDVSVTGTGGQAPRAGTPLKIMSWNIQYFAGKNYVFFYDLPEFKGPDLRPSSGDIGATFAEAVRVIEAENPDVLLLQEVDEGAGRTDKEDQTRRLQSLLNAPYPYVTETFYWKADFVPHPKIMGPVGMKLTILSRYPLEDGKRIALPQPDKDPLSRRLDLQRCLLTARIKVPGGADLRLINLHLEAFPEDPELLRSQINAFAKTVLQARTQGERVVAAGDFNLLPPHQYEALPQSQRYLYQPKSEMTPMFEAFQVIPGLVESNPASPSPWYTHFPNDNEVTGPDRTIDYILLDKGLEVISKSVRARDTLHISDHLPVLVAIKL